MVDDATLRLLTDLRAKIFSRPFDRLPFANRSVGHGDLFSRLTADIDALEAIFIIGVAPLITSLLSGIAMAIIIDIALPQALGAYCLVIAIAVLLVPALLFLSGTRPGNNLVAIGAGTRSQILDALEGHADLVAFGRTEGVEDGFARSCTRLGTIRHRLSLHASLAATAIQLLMGGALMAILIAGIPALKGGLRGFPGSHRSATLRMIATSS